MLPVITTPPPRLSDSGVPSPLPSPKKTRPPALCSVPLKPPRVSVPSPDLFTTSVAIELTTLVSETVNCGAVTFTFHVAGSVAAPLKVSVLAAVSTEAAKVVSPRKLTVFSTVCELLVSTVVRALTWNVPVPSGPLVIGPPTIGVLLAAMINPPACKLTAPVKRLCPLSCRTPLPVFVMPPFCTIELIVRPDCHGATSMPFTSVGLTTIAKVLLPLRSSVPVPMLATVPAFVGVEVMPPVSVSTPVGVTVGAAPPLLLKVSPASVFAPTSVSVEPPFIVTVFVGWICPPLVAIVTVPPLIVSPPAGTTTEPSGALRLSVPPLTTVLPEYELPLLPATGLLTAPVAAGAKVTVVPTTELTTVPVARPAPKSGWPG